MNIAIACHDQEALLQIFDLLLTQDQTSVTWMALSGEEVMESCSANAPDLLLLDLAILEKTGTGLVGRIMQQCPCPILLLETGNRDNVSLVFDALGQGAADAARIPDKPSWSFPGAWANLLSRIGTLTRLSKQDQRSIDRNGKLSSGKDAPAIVALGASTGGPRALATILACLPADLPATVVIVQHLDYHFVETLANTLDDTALMAVAPLLDNVALEPGKIWVAARPQHVILNQAHELVWTEQWPDMICRPSIDVFFNSLATYPELRGCGVLLTGMGRDGAAGLLAMRQAGFGTAAQDQGTSVVYGMPRAAAELGATDVVLPLDAIGRWIVSQVCP